MADRYIGADALADAITAQGVRTVFALAGASHAWLLAALDSRGVNIVPSRHETATVGAADGYARVAGQPGVALIIADQGLPNAVTGLATAYFAHSPVVVLVARLSMASDEAEGEIDHDRQPYAGAVTRWARTVRDAGRLEEYFLTAWKRSTYGVPGPVVLAFDQSLLTASVTPRPAARFPASPRTLPDPVALEAAATRLATAERPLIVAGGEAVRHRAGPVLRRLAADFGIPVLGNGLGRGLVAEDLQLGFAWPYAQLAVPKADLTILAGARPTRRLGFGLPPRFAAQAPMIQMTESPESLHRNRAMDVGIAGDVALGLEGLLERLTRRGRRWSSEWLATALSARTARVAEVLAERDADPAASVHPLVLGRALERTVSPTAIVVGDGADIQNWMYATFRAREAPGFLEHYPLGSMGIGLPLAVGAAAAARDAEVAGESRRPITLVTGDGAFGFYPFELQSAAQAGLPLTVIVGNDGAWGTELHGQEKLLGRAVNTRLEPSAYEHVAMAFGCRGYRVERREGLEAVLAAAHSAALLESRPTLVNVLIDPGAGAALKSDPLLNNIAFNEIGSARQAP